MNCIASSSKRILSNRIGQSTRRTLASSAYIPSNRPTQPPSPSTQNPTSPSDNTPPLAAATTSSPLLTEAEKKLISGIIRVDQAGELGANWIYRGQKTGSIIRGDTNTANQVEEMWENERLHLDVMSKLRIQHDVRPTALYPLWQGLAFGMGLATGLMGRQAAMACTEAVETVIGEHYDE